MGTPQQRTQVRRPSRERLRSAPEPPSRERIRAVREPRRREPASPRARALAIAALAAGAVLLVVLLVAVLGSGSSAPKLTPAAVAGSLMDKIGSPGPEDGARCTPRGASAWACDVPDTSGSGGASYSVTRSSGSCWKAQLVHLYGEQAPQSVSGCL